MCGIAGAVSARTEAPADLMEVVARMGVGIRHRGPDTHGERAEGPVCLGHQRLSIIDLSPEASQPMLNEDGSLMLVVNGEIYNFQALREELLAKGHTFRSRSDSEILLHLYEEHELGFLDRLRGMFALALWDARRRRLVLARDPIGKKPVVYQHGLHGLVFCSELQGLLQSGRFAAEPDLEALDLDLGLQYVPSPHCAFRGVRKLPPGHLLTYSPGEQPEVRPYHRFDFTPRSGRLDEEELAEELKQHLLEAVRIRMISDVPLGAFLSGGLDSSLVVALMAGLSSRPVKTFSVGFPDQDFSELGYARLVAERYHTDHHEMIVRPDMVDVVPRLVRHYGEPFADPSAVPTWYLTEATRKHVTVALSGDGGDETFAGYNRYRYARAVELLMGLPRPLVGGLGALLRRVPGAGRQPIRNLGLRFGQTHGGRWAGWIGHLEHRERQALYTPELQERFARDAVTARFDAHLEGSRAGDLVGRLQDTDTCNYLPDDVLVKVDIASMAHALEARAPLLDQQVVAFAASLPTRFKLHRLGTKRLLRRVARDLLPPVILERKKQGFGIPIHEWMRGELQPMSREVLLSTSARGRGLFAPGKVEALLDAHARGEPRGQQIWNLMMLELWFREFIDG